MTNKNLPQSSLLVSTEARNNIHIQGDHSGWRKPPVDMDLECSVNLPGQYVATVAAHKLLGLSELSQQEAFSVQNGYPVLYW